MATQTIAERLAREARIIEEGRGHQPHSMGALEFNDGALDRLHQRLTQAEALLATTYGEPGEGFRLLNTSLQDSFMWALADLIRAARGDLAIVSADFASVERANERGPRS